MVLIETTCESNWEQFELFPFFYTCKIVHYIILYNCIIIDSNFCCFNVEEWSLSKIVFIISERCYQFYVWVHAEIMYIEFYHHTKKEIKIGK